MADATQTAPEPKAAVLSIGTEVTRGELTNSNAAWLGEELTALGFEVVEHVTVDDDEVRIVEALRRLGEQVVVVLSTGGLGPTTDDITADSVAALLGVELVRDEPTLERIRRRWSSMGREMPESNCRQADFPKDATILPNSEGTAPGFAVTVGQARCFFMPGVPREMRAMFEDQITSTIAPMAQKRSHQVHLRTFGLPESQMADMLAGIEESHPGVTLGYRAHFPEIEVKVLARADDAAVAEANAETVAEQVRAKLGKTVYGGRDDSFAGVVGKRLRTKGWSLAIAESCTGGMVGSMVTSVPGSSDYLLLDAVCYANSAKVKVLGVSEDVLRAHGAVSGEAAAAMAEGALRVSGADVAVSITGIAGPGGGTPEKPVGTVWFGVATKDGETKTKMKRLPGDRHRIRTLASYVALNLVSRAVG